MEASREMPRYKCHKEVWALKIKELRHGQEGGDVLLIPEESGYAPVLLAPKFMVKHKPEVGGYYVVYKDGYKSYSPAQAFEEGYTRI